MASIVTSSIAINENNWGRTKKIAHFHGKINTSKILDINLGNLSCGECFETDTYNITFPINKIENITIWLGDEKWCSFGIFEHFYIRGSLITPDGLIENISVDLAHDNLYICNCKPGTLLVFKIKGQVGYPEYSEEINLDNLYLVLHLDNQFFYPKIPGGSRTPLFLIKSLRAKRGALSHTESLRKLSCYSFNSLYQTRNCC